MCIRDRAIEENDRLERMIDNILNASRLENKALQVSEETFELNTLAQSSIDRFKQLAPDADLKLEMPHGTNIKGDRLLIETILNNLVENALKYAGRSAKIVIFANGSQFGVKDNGSGVPAEDQSEIFKKFYRSGSEDTRTQKGTGLGLYIVSKLVQLHGGTINYSDNQPTGACFTIELTHD